MGREMLRLLALIYTAETNSEEFCHMYSVVNVSGNLALREIYFVLLPSESAPIVTVTWLRVREVTCSILGSELVFVLENVVCI